jgi:hypothetical protein
MSVSKPKLWRMLCTGQLVDDRQGRQRCQETQHFQMIKEEKQTVLLVLEKSVSTAVREISSCKSHMIKKWRERSP